MIQMALLSTIRSSSTWHQLLRPQCLVKDTFIFLTVSKFVKRRGPRNGNKDCRTARFEVLIDRKNEIV
jgi:hypothetical protein